MVKIRRKKLYPAFLFPFSIDQKLAFRDHINSKVNSANIKLGIIFRIFTFIDEQMLLNLYKSIVRPHFCLATSLHKDKIILQNVQRRATRLTNSCISLSYQQKLWKLGLPTLEYRTERADLIQVYNIIHEIDDIDKEKLLTRALYGIFMNMFVCRNDATYYVWISYILTKYISSAKVLEFGHDEMCGDSPQYAFLRLT